MSKTLIDIPDHLEGKELFKFLKENKKQLIAQKKAVTKHFDCGFSIVNLKKVDIDKTTGEKTFKLIGDDEAAPADATELHVTVAANTSMYCDSHQDVLLRGAGKKTLKQRKSLWLHLKDHDWTTDGEIGKVTDMYYQELPLRDLGIKEDGTAEVLTMESDVIKAWGERAFERYRQKRARQHSIGLRYIDIKLAVNEPDDEYWEDEYKVYKKWIDQIINKEQVESRGYFFAVYEFMLLETSLVILGSNPITPTLDTVGKSTTDHTPSDDTVDKSEEKTTEPVDISAIIGGMKLF